MGAIKSRVAKLARSLGYDVRRVESQPEAQWMAHARPLIERRDAQTIDDARALRRKYEEPVFGEVAVWELVERQALCIDEMDVRLGLVNQFVHALQVADGMVADGITDDELLVVALVHDIGKLPVLVGEDPANVGSMTYVMSGPEPGAGLDQCIVQWGHDEFGYTRLRDHVPEHLAWLVRYHSIDIEQARPFMDERDATYVEQYLRPFRHYDGSTKSIVRMPDARNLARYREMIEEAFPHPIRF